MKHCAEVSVIRSIDISTTFKYNMKNRKASKTFLDPIAAAVVSVGLVVVVDAVVVVVGPVVVDVVTNQSSNASGLFFNQPQARSCHPPPLYHY